MLKHYADRHRAKTAARNRTYEEQRVDAACGAGVATRTPVQLDQAIVALLQLTGPQMKWQIREALHEPEGFIWRRLKALKAQGVVKVTGKTLDRRAWVLTTWDEPKDRRAAVAARYGATGAPRLTYGNGSKPPPTPSRSWWVNVPREAFGTAVRAETKRMTEEPRR